MAVDDTDESFEVIDEENCSDIAVVTEQNIELDWQTRSDITIWDNYWDRLQSGRTLFGISND